MKKAATKIPQPVVVSFLILTRKPTLPAIVSALIGNNDGAVRATIYCADFNE